MGMVQPIPMCFRSVLTRTERILFLSTCFSSQRGGSPLSQHVILYLYTLQCNNNYLFTRYPTRCPDTRAANLTRVTRVRVITPGRVGWSKCHPDPTQTGHYF